MSLAELSHSLGVTKGNVSIAIRTLEQLGMVKHRQLPGDRRVLFEAEPDFWNIAHRVLERRQKPEFDESFQMLDESIKEAQDAPSSEEQKFVLERLRELRTTRFLQGVGSDRGNFGTESASTVMVGSSGCKIKFSAEQAIQR